MTELWQQTFQFRQEIDKLPTYKFVGDVPSYVSGVYWFTGQDIPHQVKDELQIRIKAIPLDLYSFHTNPSELIGYEDGVLDKIQDTVIHRMHKHGNEEIYEEIVEGIWDTILETLQDQFGDHNSLNINDDDIEFRDGEEGEIIAYVIF